MRTTLMAVGLALVVLASACSDPTAPKTDQGTCTHVPLGGGPVVVTPGPCRGT